MNNGGEILFSVPVSVKNKKEMNNLLFEDLRIDVEEFKKLNYKDLLVLCDLYKSTNLKYLKKVIGDMNENNIRTNDRKL